MFEQTEFFAVSGIVIDGNTDQPLAGVRVVEVDGSESGFTRPDGFYNITVASGEHTLSFSIDGYENLERSIVVDGVNLALPVILIPLGSSSSSSSQMPSGNKQPSQGEQPSDQTSPPPSVETATITGKVTDVKTGRPIAVATVRTGIYRTTTGVDGAYSLSVALGTYNLTVSARGYEENVVSVTATEKETYNVDVTLTPPQYSMTATANPDYIWSAYSNRESTITVVVKKADGTSAAGIEVFFNSSGTDVVGRFKSSSAVTDQKGTASVVWTCAGEASVEDLNVINARRIAYWTIITAWFKVGDQSFTAECWIVTQKESCHRSC